MSKVDDDREGYGAGLSSKALVIDAALADWIYHRDKVDQSFGLGEITGNAKILKLDKPVLDELGLTIGSDGFLYNESNGFVAAIVKIGGKFTIVYRGTDLPAFELGNAWAIANQPDVRQDIQIGLGFYSSSDQAHNAVALAQYVIKNLAGGDVSKVHLVGQSLGGGLVQ